MGESVEFELGEFTLHVGGHTYESGRGVDLRVCLVPLARSPLSTEEFEREWENAVDSALAQLKYRAPATQEGFRALGTALLPWFRVAMEAGKISAEGSGGPVFICGCGTRAGAAPSSVTSAWVEPYRSPSMWGLGEAQRAPATPIGSVDLGRQDALELYRARLQNVVASEPSGVTRAATDDELLAAHVETTLPSEIA